MKTLTRAAAALALALPLGLATAAPASAAPAPGAACAQAGIATLKSLGALQLAASKQLDYSTLTGPTAIRADLPGGLVPVARRGREAAPHQPGAVRLVRLT